MASGSNFYVGDVPREILMKIFSNLDPSSLLMAGQVCHKWSEVVQMIHDDAWKSVTGAVMLDKETIGPKYKARGWIEEDHSWNECKCLEMLKNLVFYGDIEKLDDDLKVLYTTNHKFEGYEYEEVAHLVRHGIIDLILTLEQIGEIEAIGRLAAAGIITDIKGLSLMNINLLDVKNVDHLLGVSKRYIGLVDISSDWSPVFDQINCKLLVIDCFEERGPFDDAELESLNKLLNERVEMFTFYCGFKNEHLQSILLQHYDGHGKCHRIELSSQGGLDVDGVQDWANINGWSVKGSGYFITLKRQ